MKEPTLEQSAENTKVDTSQVTARGLWFSHNGISFSQGFSKEEVVALGSQVMDASIQSRDNYKYQHVQVRLNGEDVYVMIDTVGAINEPRRKGEQTPIRTSDPSQIGGFRTSEDWYKY